MHIDRDKLDKELLKLDPSLLLGEPYHLEKVVQGFAEEFDSSDYGTMDYSVKLDEEEIAQCIIAGIEAADKKAMELVEKMNIPFAELFPNG